MATFSAYSEIPPEEIITKLVELTHAPLKLLQDDDDLVLNREQKNALINMRVAVDSGIEWLDANGHDLPDVLED